MMWPRLHMARSLLADDGVIAVSIDDVEVSRLRLLMDEIFGEENFMPALSGRKCLAQRTQRDTSLLIMTTS